MTNSRTPTDIDRAFEVIHGEYRLVDGQEYDPDFIFFNEIARRAAIDRYLLRHAKSGDSRIEQTVFRRIAQTTLKDLEE